MPNYVVKVFPKDSIKLAQEPTEALFNQILATLESLPALVFNRELKKPRAGFDTSSISIADYGIEAIYLVEKELIIPTIDGDVREFQKIAVPGKYIFEQGVLLISNSSEAIIEKVSAAWSQLLFPTRIISPITLEIPKEKFHEIIYTSAKTVIRADHTESKGLERIHLKAFDLTNKEWYKEEGFDFDSAERYDFIASLPESFGGKTVICKMYRNGRFVIYQNARFSEKEFEQIQLFLVKKIAEILGSPLCQHGASEMQMRLNL